MEASITNFNFHHSSHGYTMLHKLLVDKDRGLKYILLKYGFKKIDNDELFNLSINEMIDILDINKIQLESLIVKHKDEIESIPIVYPILGVYNGLEVEFHYKIRGGQCQTILARQYTADPIHNKFPKYKYSDYMVINAIGNNKNEGIIQTIKLFKDDYIETFYDANSINNPSNKFCKSDICNIPNIQYNYEADFNVGLIELEYDSDSGYLITPYYEDDGSTESKQRALRYPGSTFDMDTKGYLHAYSNESMKKSLLNMIMNGSGNINWPEDMYERYFGLKTKINKSIKKVIINIYASHCLSPQELDSQGGIGNVIPFITDYNHEWSRLYLDELADGAEEEIEWHEDLLDEKETEINDGEDEIKALSGLIIDKEKGKKKYLKPLLDDEPLPDGWIEEIDEDGDTYYINNSINKVTYTRDEIPYLVNERRSDRIRDKTYSKIKKWKTLDEQIDELQDEINKLESDIDDMNKTKVRLIRKIDKSENVRDSVYNLYNASIAGDAGEILSTKRRSNIVRKSRRKSRRKKISKTRRRSNNKHK